MIFPSNTDLHAINIIKCESVGSAIWDNKVWQAAGNRNPALYCKE